MKPPYIFESGERKGALEARTEMPVVEDRIVEPMVNETAAFTQLAGLGFSRVEQSEGEREQFGDLEVINLKFDTSNSRLEKLRLVLTRRPTDPVGCYRYTLDVWPIHPYQDLFLKGNAFLTPIHEIVSKVEEGLGLIKAQKDGFVTTLGSMAKGKLA